MNNNKPIPPKLAERLLHWFLKDELAEEVLGDLEEKFYCTLEQRSLLRANLNYWFQVFNYFRPFAIRKNKYTHTINFTDMFRINLKLAHRNLWKHKFFSLINIAGLAIGMAACLLILQYVNFELSYDDFRKPTVYRISASSYMNGEKLSDRAQTAPALAPALQRDLPEIVRAARLVHTDPFMPDPVMQTGKRSFHENKIYYADPEFLAMFSYKMEEGDIDQALKQPNSVVISATMAHKYFPFTDALGKTFTFLMGERGQEQLKITGIFSDIPENSHLHTDFLISFNSLPWDLDENWDWGNFYNYIALAPTANPSVVEEKIGNVIKKYRGDVMADWLKSGYVRDFNLQQIQNIHLDSHQEAEAEVNGSRSTVEFLTLIAIFILIIAWINYLNLTTAKSVERAKEIGIRKVVGSNRKQLIGQFLSESLVVNLMAVILAIILARLLMPTFHNITGGHFTINLNTEIIVKAIGLFLAGTFLSGFYPAFVLASYQPLKVLKGKVKSSKRGVILRKGLVVFQFIASITLIIGTLAVEKQLNFMRQQDIGLNIEQTLVVKGPGIKDSTYQQHLAFFKNEVKKLPVVQEVAQSSSIPGRELSWAREFYQPTQPDHSVSINIVAVDEDFLNVYGTTFIAGHNFSQQFQSDQNALIFNETAIRQLGFKNAEDAVQQNIIWNESDNDKHSKRIIGVIQDFNQESLHKKVGPMVFVLKRYLNAPWAGEYYSLKLLTKDYTHALADIKQDWSQAFPNSPFDYFFLDDFFNKQYQADQQFGQIFSLFAGLGIFIACLGLLGLSSYMTLQRTKEVGIRKILGASKFGVIRLLSTDFTWTVLIAIIIAIPLSYFFTNKWLNHFAYKVELEWWFFMGAGFIPLFIAWLTIGLQTAKAASINPIHCLKDE